jgi:DNA repair protein RadC
MVQDNTTDQKGHRQRLRQRFVEAGPGALADYEMLELLLFHVIPRRDTKPVAKRLINHFGSYAAVLRVDVKSLSTVKGVGDTTAIMLKSVADAAERLARDEVMDRVVLSSWEALIDYLKISMARQETERFRILFLDVKNALIADEEQQSGTVNHAPVYPREVIKRALELGASALILIHNHPSGIPDPSPADIDMTRKIEEAGDQLGIRLHDHIIVAREGTFSMRSEGLI